MINSVNIWYHGCQKIWIMLFLLVISLFVSNSINSQEYNYKFKHLTEKDGLPNGYIHAILQDSKGFMWFGSEEGLIRYDGYAFMYFKYSAINPNSQIGDNIRSIVEDKYSNLWMGSVQVLTYYNRLNDNFYTYQYDPKDSTSINTSCIYSVKLDDRENLWAGSCDSGLLYLDVKTHKFKRFMHHAANENSISSNHVQVVYLDSKKTLWVGFNEGIIDILEKGSTEFKHLVFLDE